jgi:hypothetical protein
LLGATRTTTPSRARARFCWNSVLIGGQEDFETRVRGALQKISILEASPTLLLDCADIVAG